MQEKGGGNGRTACQLSVTTLHLNHCYNCHFSSVLHAVFVASKLLVLLIVRVDESRNLMMVIFRQQCGRFVSKPLSIMH